MLCLPFVSFEPPVCSGKSAAEELEDELAAVSEAIDEPEMNDGQLPRDDTDEESDVELDAQDFDAGKSEQVPLSFGDEDEDGQLGDSSTSLDTGSAAQNASNEALHEGDMLGDAPGGGGPAPSRPMQALEDAKADRGKRPSQLTKQETETLSHMPPKGKGSRTVYDILIKVCATWRYVPLRTRIVPRVLHAWTGFFNVFPYVQEIKSIKLQMQIINRLLDDVDSEPKLIDDLDQVRLE